MSPLLSRIAALGLLLAVIAGLVFGALVPLVDRVRAAQEDIADLEDQLRRFRGELAGMSAPAGIEIGEPALVDAATPAVAAAKIQEAVDAAVRAAGARLSSLRVEPALPLGPAERVPVTAEIAADMAAAQELLHAISVARPYLRITRADIRRPRARQAEGAPVELMLRLRIVGLMRAREVPAGAER